MPGRILLFHYHLFKNAGTSVDEMLKHNFGVARWEQKEFPTPAQRSNVELVQEYLESRPDLDAFSSHTACLPPPQLRDREVFPLLFLRHPIDRVRSAYAFERRQDAETFGAVLAKQESFQGYVTKLLENPTHRQARNFQTYRLAFGYPAGAGSELERATETIAALPFVGLVEAYEASLARLGELLSPMLPGFQTLLSRRNVTQGENEDLPRRLENIAEELGPKLNDALWDANRDDLALFEIMRQRYGV